MPHRFRIETYNRHDYIGAALKQGIDQFQIVRVVRDPLARAVSSFRHALATDYATDDIRTKLGLSDRLPLAISFEQWITYLELSDLLSCNLHHRVQFHPLEAIRTPNFVINVSRQNLYAELNLVEQTLGMPLTDFRNMAWLNELHKERDFQHRIGLLDAPSTAFSQQEARYGPWPDDQSLLRDDLKERLKRLYAIDLQAYYRQ